MRTHARKAAATLIAILLGCPPAFANPLAFVLANPETAPEISDPAASNDHEAAGEPAATGELDAADLSKLGGRLASIALSYETFRDPSHLDADAKLLVDYTSPQGLIPNPADRAQTLDRVYRALALLDDTQALRYPEGDACARAHRRALLRSPDGLFADPITGDLAPWLKAELKRSKANDAPGGLIAASARKWTALGYLKSLAEVRTISLRLAEKKVLGAPRAEAYCRRAQVYENLASAQASLRWNDPDLTAQAKSVVEVRWGKESGSGTALLVDGRTVVLVPGRFTENAYEAPDLFAKSGRRLSAAYARRGPTLSLLSIQPSPDIEPLALPSKPEEGERIAYSIGHPIQGGPWSVTRGLAQPEGALIRTDTAIDEAQAGGPLFDAQGGLIGIIAGQGTAYDVSAVKSWLADEKAALPEASNAPELGTGALLTASTTLAPKEKGGLIEAGSSFNSNPTGVCVDSRGCGMPSAPLGGESGYSAPYTGPNLWSMLGKLLRPAPKIEPRIEDNRHYVAPTVVREAPKPPPEPPKPECSFAVVSPPKTVGADPVELKVRFSCKYGEGAKELDLGGHEVVFTVGWKGDKTLTRAVPTDADGFAKLSLIVQSVESAAEKAHDALDKYDPSKKPPVAPADKTVAPVVHEAFSGGAIILVRNETTKTALIEVGAQMRLGLVASRIIVAGKLGASFVVGWKIGKFALAVDKEMNESLDKYNEAIDTHRDDHPKRESKQDEFDELDGIAEAYRDKVLSDYPLIGDLKADCVPGRRLAEPSASVKGGTSIEQEYICRNGVHTRHTIVDKAGKIVHDHFRPGPPKGGGGD